MTGPAPKHRHRMVNVQPGYVVFEREQFSLAFRSYFTTEAVPPKEEYREGSRVWRYFGTAQSFQFDIEDTGTGEVTKLRELLGLVYYGVCRADSDLYRIGDLAHESGISIYIAVTYEAADGARINISMEKLRLLNRLFNERLRTPGKRILILPDMFGLYKEMSLGQIAIDFGLTSMDTEG